jgi:glucosyl-3-phosphoglycerate synthase
VLRQFQARDQDFERIEHHIVEEERPPMIEVPAYREKMGLQGSASQDDGAQNDRSDET